MTSTTLDHATFSANLDTTAQAPGKKARIAGRVLTGFASAFLTFDGVIKLLGIEAVRTSSEELGYPPSTMVPIGITLLACLIVHLVPRTAVFGAVLLTGYLGGAIATHVGVGNPLASHVFFPVYVAALIWGGLYLRDARVRALIGPRDRV